MQEYSGHSYNYVLCTGNYSYKCLSIAVVTWTPGDVRGGEDRHHRAVAKGGGGGIKGHVAYKGCLLGRTSMDDYAPEFFWENHVVFDNPSGSSSMTPLQTTACACLSFQQGCAIVPIHFYTFIGFVLNNTITIQPAVGLQSLLRGRTNSYLKDKLLPEGQYRLWSTEVPLSLHCTWSVGTHGSLTTGEGREPTSGLDTRFAQLLLVLWTYRLIEPTLVEAHSVNCCVHWSHEQVFALSFNVDYIGIQ